LIAELERLRFAWRGDRFEFTVIRRLAELYFDGGDHRQGLRLAQIRLLNRQPEMALRALDRSDSSDPPDDLAAQRRRTRAEALLERGRGDEALAALEGDSTSEALRLRAEILWRQGDWPAAALVLAQLVPDAPPARPLNDAQSDMVMKLAVASTMAGDAERLAALNAAYGEAMKGTESASAFAVLVRESGTGAGAPIARQLAEVAEFETFLADYRAGLKSGAGN
jgi:tetratricopeptide (TPR) repeat protein